MDCFFFLMPCGLIACFVQVHYLKRFFSAAKLPPFHEFVDSINILFMEKVVFKTSMIFVFQTELSFPVFKRRSNLTPTKKDNFHGEKKSAVADTIPETKVKLTLPKLKELRCDWRLLGRLKKCRGMHWFNG